MIESNGRVYEFRSFVCVLKGNFLDFDFGIYINKGFPVTD